MRGNLFTAFYAGFVALYAQTLMLRTALTLFDGNELVTGLFLALWMLLTAAGARIKPSSGREWPAILTAAMALLLPLAEVLVPGLFRHFFLRGSMPALYQTAFFFLGMDSTLLPAFREGIWYAGEDGPT
jgi:hypothetical protein